MGQQPAPPCFSIVEASSFISIINRLPWVLPCVGLEEDPGGGVQGLQAVSSSWPTVT